MHINFLNHHCGSARNRTFNYEYDYAFKLSNHQFGSF